MQGKYALKTSILQNDSRRKPFRTYICQKLNYTLMKTYIAFDAHGVSQSLGRDLKNYTHVMTWQKSYPTRFDFVNLHDIRFTSQHSGLVDTTVRTYLEKKMEQAENLLILVSEDTNVDSPILNWQITRSVNRHHLPVIVAYEGESSITTEVIARRAHKLPTALRHLMSQNAVKVAHIPFQSGKIESACKHFSSRAARYPWSTSTIF